MIRVGISGWTYPPWRGSFFPPGLPHNKELEFASKQFATIEINGTFYGLQRPSSYQRWYEAPPGNFRFSVKASRYITHILRLREIEIPLANFFASGPLCLREKLGPVLWQFPPSLKFDPERFEKFLRLLPKDFNEARDLAWNHDPRLNQLSGDEFDGPIRHAIEIRNPSFCTPDFTSLLRKHNAALVVSDSGGKWPHLEEITADFTYVRLHGVGRVYVSGYGNSALELWARKIRKWSTSGHQSRDVFVFFDNDVKVRAPFDALKLAQKLRAAPATKRAA